MMTFNMWILLSILILFYIRMIGNMLDPGTIPSMCVLFCFVFIISGPAQLRRDPDCSDFLGSQISLTNKSLILLHSSWCIATKVLPVSTFCLCIFYLRILNFLDYNAPLLLLIQFVWQDIAFILLNWLLQSQISGAQQEQNPGCFEKQHLFSISSLFFFPQ